MGTRNITSVIMDGRKPFFQYCQWDGYPTYVGDKVLSFLKSSDLSHFRKALENTHITVTDYEKAVSYTGSTKDYGYMSEAAFEARRFLSEQNGEWPDFETLYKHLLDQGKFSGDELENYFVWTRDTGCDLLSLIYNRSLDKPPLELYAMTHEYNGDYSWDIQGIYIIDLDTNKVYMTFDGYSCDFDIDHLPADIEKAMLVFEKTTYQLYERKNDIDYSSFAPEVENANHAGPAWDLAKELADAICDELSEEDPERFANLKGEPYITAQDCELIYTILLNKAEKDLEIAKEATEVSVNDKIQAAENKAAEAVPKIDGITIKKEPER